MVGCFEIAFEEGDSEGFKAQTRAIQMHILGAVHLLQKLKRIDFGRSAVDPSDLRISFFVSIPLFNGCTVLACLVYLRIPRGCIWRNEQIEEVSRMYTASLQRFFPGQNMESRWTPVQGMNPEGGVNEGECLISELQSTLHIPHP